MLRIEENATKPGEVQPASGLGDLAHVSALDKHQAAANAAIAAGLVKHQYAYESILQGYDVYVPEPPNGITVEKEKKRVWVVYAIVSSDLHSSICFRHASGVLHRFSPLPRDIFDLLPMAQFSNYFAVTYMEVIGAIRNNWLRPLPPPALCS